MKKQKTPGIIYVLYTFFVLILIFGLVTLVGNCMEVSKVLTNHTFAEMPAAAKTDMINMIVEPILTYGFQLSLLGAAAYACRKLSGCASADEDELSDSEMEEATFGTVLSEDDLEEARNMVEANAAEQSEDAK